MDVKLYYIEGISRSDTPYYFSNNGRATLAKQESYFAQHLVTTISTSFYPPHYTNEIKFDVEDVDFNDTVNYLSLTFKGKTYYYFIDDIEYMSEAIVKLYITMDVIQTYMFNIRIASGVIERKFINRWNSEAINRNYLRENVSRGNKLQTNYITYDSAYENGFLIMRKTAESGKYSSVYSITGDADFPNSTINVTATDLRVTLFPGGMLNYGGAQPKLLSAADYYKYLCDDPYVWDAYVIPFNPFDNISVVHNSYTSNEWVPEVDSAGNDTGGINQGTYGQTAKNSTYVLKNISKNYLFPFVKNKYVKTVFDYSMEPCLLDENYIEYYFGTRGVYTSYPLHKLITTRVHNHYYADIFTGNRYYKITDENDHDIYRTCVVDANTITLEFLNDNWKQYKAANKTRWASAIVNTGLDIIQTMATQGGSKVGVIGKDISKVNEVKYAHLARNKKGQFTKKLSRVGAITTTTERNLYGNIPTGDRGEWAGEMASALSPLISQGFADLNAKFKPDSLRGTLNIGDISGYAYDIVCWQETVDDIAECGQYYHRNGNLVNEYVNNVDDIFDYVVNRYYYNLVKMDLAEVHLSGVIEDQATIAEIQDRLSSGVRLWRVIKDTVQRDTSYDNTPRDLSQTYTFTSPYRINTLFNGEALLVPSTGGGTATVTIISHDDYNITYSLSGGGSTGVKFTVKFNGVFFEDAPVVHIGDYTYDNVELDYL